MKVSEMTFREWVDALENRGSANDPIYYKGQETTPETLSYEFGACDKIHGVRIIYSGGEPFRKINGTCGGMLRERAATVPLTTRSDAWDDVANRRKRLNKRSANRRAQRSR